MNCDKPFVRDLMPGLYAEVLNLKAKAHQSSDRAREIYKSVAQQKDRVFPLAVSTEFTIKTPRLDPSIGSLIKVARHGTGNDASKKTVHQQLNLFKDILQELEALAASDGPEAQDLFTAFDEQGASWDHGNPDAILPGWGAGAIQSSSV